MAINIASQVVGNSSTNATAQGHAFLWSADQGMIDLNDVIPPNSGWLLQIGIGINDNGQIVGFGINPAGKTHAFLLIPVTK
jgi:probable HAF family extracellular repeat protein